MSSEASRRIDELIQKYKAYLKVLDEFQARRKTKEKYFIRGILSALEMLKSHSSNSNK